MIEFPGSPPEKLKEPAKPYVIPYYPPSKPPGSSSFGQIAAGFALYQICVILLSLTYQRPVPIWQSLTEWLVLTAILIAGGVGMGMSYKKWGYLKGIIAAFVLTGSCCGLLFSTCGNPFGPGL